MRNILLMAILFSSVAWGCKVEWQYGESSTGCILVNGVKRDFRYYLPKHAKGVSLPMIIGLHGGGDTPKSFESYSRFSELSATSGSFITVYPKAKDKHWNDGRDGLKGGIDDVGFVKTLIGLLPHVDKNEVYVVGMSNGGLMTQRLACEIPQMFQGVGVVAATMSETLSTLCTSKKPLKSVFFFGDKDSAFLDNGNLVNPVKPTQIRGQHIGIEKTLALWKKRNGCQSSKLTREINKLNKKWGKEKEDGTSIKVHDYKGCKKPMRYYEISGGGHRWPDSEAKNGMMVTKLMKIGIASHEISAAQEIIDFFHVIKK